MPKHRKELNFFGKDIYKKKVSKKKYLDYFKDATTETALGEGDPWYMFSEDAPKEIKKFNKNSKIIMILRNPVSFLSSLHKHNVYEGIEPLSFQEAILETKNRKKNGVSEKAKQMPVMLYYEDLIMYHKYIDNYKEVFGDNLLVVIFEEYIKYPKQTFRTLQEFLNVDIFLKDNKLKKINNSPKVRSKALQTVYSNLALRSFSQKYVPYSIRCFGNYIKKLNTKRVGREKVPESIKKKLLERYKSDISKTEKILGKSLKGYWY